MENQVLTVWVVCGAPTSDFFSQFLTTDTMSFKAIALQCRVVFINTKSFYVICIWKDSLP